MLWELWHSVDKLIFYVYRNIGDDERYKVFELL